MRRSVTSLLFVVLVGCNAISYPTSPPLSTSSAVVPTRLAIVLSPVELPQGGGTALVYLETSVDGQSAAPRVRVAVSTTDGTLDATEVTTDDTGHARLSWSGVRAATVTAVAGALQTSAQVRVAQPIALPPPSSPPPPLPPLPPDPPPPPTPEGPTAVAVSLAANRTTAPVGIDVTFSANVDPRTLQPGETILGYQWDFVSGISTDDATTTSNVRAYGFGTHGMHTPKVTVVTSAGRQASGTVQIAITN